MTEPVPAAVRILGLRRDFGHLRAVDGIDLEIPAGAVFGLLGPDGAGKSTLLRMLATVLTPSAGEALVFGDPVGRPTPALTGRIGYMAQRFSMYPDLSIAENLDFFARVRGVPRGPRRERAAELLDRMGLAAFAGRQARNLSGGMKQKLMLASTLMHDPDLLLLDEPTTGVDPVSRREFWEILARVHAEGRTVVVSTPYMDEASRCSQIGFMSQGRITHTGTPAELSAAVPGTLLEVTAADSRAALAALPGLVGLLDAHLLGDTVRVLVDASAADAPAAVVAHLAASGIEAEAAAIPTDMETVFAHLAGEEAA